MRSTAISWRALRAAVHAAALVVAARIWSMLLFKEHLDRPGLVAAWLGAGLLLTMASIMLARRTPQDRRNRLQARLASIAGPDLAFVALLFVLLFLFHWGFDRVASDGREYFVQVRSLVIDRDLDFANENANFGVRGTAGRYPFGAPVLWVPFFLIAHLTVGVWNLLGAELLTNGLTNPYQRAIGVGTLVYGFIALVLVYRILTHHFTRWLATVSTLTVGCGSFILWYLVADNSMSHGASMFAVTLFLYVWHRGRGDDSLLRRWMLLGAAAGLMSMVRWQNVLFVVFPIAEEIGALGPRWRLRLRRGAARYAACVAAFVLAFSPQLIFWKVVRGEWLAPVATDHAVAWTSPLVANVLFSSDRGLFSWTPILLFAVLGLPLLWRRDRLLAGASLLAFAGQVYINSLVEQGGHGFGARKFAGCAVIFALGLAAFLEWMKERPRLAVGLFAGTFVLLNAFFMLDISRGRLPATGTVTFDEMLGAMTSKLGNPFVLPMGAWLAWRYDADLGMYERLGKQTFNNIHIDLGAADDGRFLARGWSGRETGSDLDYRWSLGSSSSLVVPLKQSAPYEIALRAAPHFHPDDELQIIDLWVNGVLVERLALQPGMHTYGASLSADLVHAGYNEIVFRYSYVVSPRALGYSADPRELAVRFDTLSLIRRG